MKSDVQQQVFAFPWTDHRHEFLVFQILDRRIHIDETFAQHGAQFVFVTQQLQRFRQTLRA